MSFKNNIKKILKKILGINNTKMPQVFKFPKGVYPITETTDNDVFIVGFPKSGNTLMQHIIGHLYYGLNDKTSRSLINLIAPDIYVNSHYFRLNQTCFFKSHNLPEKRYKNVIYIMRDGREALLSYYYMMKNINQDVSLEDLYTSKEKIFDTTWKDHIQAWEKNPYNANILWVKYEDLLDNKYREIQKICEFLNLNKTKEEILDVVNYTSFEYMKQVEQKKDWKLMKKDMFKEGTSFVRSGKLDSYKSEVPKHLIASFEEYSKETLNKYYS